MICFSLYLEINDGKVRAATTPITPSVINTSARVNPFNPLKQATFAGGGQPLML